MKIADKVINNILGKKKKGKDTDGDSVFDKDDCEPKNTMRQDAIGAIGPTRLKQMRARLTPQTPSPDQPISPEEMEKKKIRSKIY